MACSLAPLRSQSRIVSRLSSLALGCAIVLCVCSLPMTGQSINTTTPGANCTGSSSNVCVSTYHNDNARDGVNSNETVLNPSLFNTINPPPRTLDS